MRSLAVVLVFVGLNAVGFFAYRAFSTPEAAASDLDDSPPTAADTFSREPPPSQPKPAAPARHAVAAPETVESADTAPSNKSNVTVSPDTKPSAGERHRLPAHGGFAHHTHAKPAAHKRVERAERAVAPVAKPARQAPVPVDAKPAGQDQPARAKAKPENKLLEMEANPYKQSE